MITPDPKDDPTRVKRQELNLKPVTNDMAAATIPVGGSATPEELQALRDRVNALNSISEPPKQTVAALMLPQQQSTPYADNSQTTQTAVPKSNGAANLIRAKLSKLYAKEPDAGEEVIESYKEQDRSKHQQYMYDLTNSGQGLADIQTQWHNYYTALPDAQKHEVWQEFYSAHEHAQRTPRNTLDNIAGETSTPFKQTFSLSNNPTGDTRTVADIKQQVLKRVGSGKKASIKQHAQSLLFGLGMASLVIVFLLFGFFNERFIAPFISPSRQVSSTPIVGNDTKVGPEPRVLIAKINLEVPVVYGTNSNDEAAIQKNLEDGVVHYSNTPTPGQAGNVVIVGHSSNNIFNKGKYKFAFVLLKQLEVGDTFSLNKDGVRYTYQVFEKKIVKPTDISVLGPTAKPNTATLITCDPPGTSINRLVVVGEQVSPDPSGNKAVEQAAPTLTNTGVLPSNSPSFWQRIKNFF